MANSTNSRTNSDFSELVGRRNPAWLRKWLGILAAERVSGLERVNRQFRQVHNLAQRTQNAAFSRLRGGPIETEHDLMDEDMAVSVGDQIHYHQQQPSRGGSLLPWVLMAAMGSGGGVYLLMQHLAGLRQPPVVVEDTDTDTTTELEIYRPEENTADE